MRINRKAIDRAHGRTLIVTTVLFFGSMLLGLASLAMGQMPYQPGQENGVIVTIDCPDDECAKRLGDDLLRNRLAAMHQRKPVTTTRIEGGKLSTSEGVSLEVRTTADRFTAVADAARRMLPGSGVGVVATSLIGTTSEHAAFLTGLDPVPFVR